MMEEGKVIRTIYVGSLSEDELLLLDGKCRPDVQPKVDEAKRNLSRIGDMPDIPEGDAIFIGKAVDEAKTKGKLAFRYEQLRWCPVCRRDAGYAKRTRTSAKGRTGEPNRSKPLSLSGVELGERFVCGRAAIGCCRECWGRVKPLLAQELAGVQAEIPSAITDKSSPYKWYAKSECVCGWSGGENEMGQLPAMMGGYYPGQCPKCGAKDVPFGRRHFRHVPGFVLVELAELKAASGEAG